MGMSALCVLLSLVFGIKQRKKCLFFFWKLNLFPPFSACKTGCGTPLNLEDSDYELDWNKVIVCIFFFFIFVLSQFVSECVYFFFVSLSHTICILSFVFFLKILDYFLPFLQIFKNFGQLFNFVFFLFSSNLQTFWTTLQFRKICPRNHILYSFFSLQIFRILDNSSVPKNLSP